jgi:hypothetical protein
MRKCKAAASTEVFLEMMSAESLAVEWLTDWCNVIVIDGKISDD